MTAAKHVLLVESYPAHPSQHAEFNAWYESTHVPEVVALDGFVGATRLKPADPFGPYVLLYHLDGDPEQAMANVKAAAAAKQLDMSGPLSYGPIPTMKIYEVYSEYTKPA